MATDILQPAFPYVTVAIDLRGLTPTARRAPGVVAVVGDGAGAAPVNTPVEVTDHGSVMATFASGNASNPLTRSLDLVLAQDPRPTTVYGVRTAAAGGYADALAGLEAADDVTFVCLAEEVAPGSGSGAAATGLTALKQHVHRMSSDGNKRLGVAMVDPSVGRSTTYVVDVLDGTAYGSLRSDQGRMVLIAARGATAEGGGTGDAAAAAMGAIAGYTPSTSVVLKRVRGITMPVTSQYAPAEITGLAKEGIIPLVDPALIPGTGLYLGDGGTFSSEAALNFVDIVRVLDDLEFRLRAGLIGQVGDSRITRSGLITVRIRVDGILGAQQRAGVIDGYDVQIPVLDVLSLPPSSRNSADDELVRTARETRRVQVLVTVVYGPAVHQLNVTLAPIFS